MIGGEPIEKEGTGVKTALDDAFAYAVLSIVEETRRHCWRRRVWCAGMCATWI